MGKIRGKAGKTEQKRVKKRQNQDKISKYSGRCPQVGSGQKRRKSGEKPERKRGEIRGENRGKRGKGKSPKNGWEKTENLAFISNNILLLCGSYSIIYFSKLREGETVPVFAKSGMRFHQREVEVFMKKRIVSILLAVVMIVGLIPLSVIPAAAATNGPMLVPDFNRDGVIDNNDMEQAKAKTEGFTIWLNDDDDAEGAESDEGKGDSNTDEHNVPSGNDDMDYADGVVNGRCDLLDFFPVLVNVHEVEDWSEFTWKIKTTGEASVNVVFTKLRADKAGSFYTQAVNAFNGETPLYKADTTPLETETDLPEGFLNHDDQNGTGILLIEGSALGEGNIVLTGYRDGSDPVSLNFPIKVANVEDMYRRVNLRQGEISETDEPAARKDADSDGRQFVFVHGYNVTHDEARGEASDFYKKLWQTGSDSMFTAVEWDSDESRMEILGENLTFNYYANVENAFAAAEAFKNQCDRLPGKKYLIGHSLGNMLICSAIQDFGLEYEKYFMLNAAIAKEAFDKNALDDGMIDDYWENNIPESERASHWYETFSQDTEYRSTLTWKGRFEDVNKNVINLYSPSDEFLANCPDDVNREADDNEPGKTFTEKLTGSGFWAFTEKIKGTDYIDVINELFITDTDKTDDKTPELWMNCEGGWGVNEDYDPGDSSPANTRFTPFMDERMAYEEMPFISSSEAVALRAQLLADAIPAESYAAGSNTVSTLTNINLESFIGENENWPSYTESEETGNKENLWKHHDVTDIAYYHTYKLYDYISANPWNRLCEGKSLEGTLEVSVADGVKTIKLLSDITADSSDAPFRVEIWNGMVILDLNGHSIDFSQAKGSAIVVRNAGDLTIIDSSESSCGKITGGTGQTIDEGVSDKLYGGGVLVLDGKLTMTSGTVTGNSADFGGGIYVAGAGELYVGGTAKIYGNLSSDATAANNLFLQDNKYITICSSPDGLDTGAEIGISKTGTGKFTANGTEADAKYFFSDAEGKFIKHETDGGDRLELAEAPNIGMTVNFDMQEGGGGTITVEARFAYAMPEITVPSMIGYTFDGYYDESGKAYYNANGESVRHCDRQEDFTLYAHWKNNTYNIIYKDKGGVDFTGEHETGYPTTHTYGSDTILKSASKEDYIFMGWCEESDCSGYPITTISEDSAGDITLYAQWAPTSCNVNLIFADGNGGSAQVTAHYGQPLEIDTFPTRDGLVFAGFYDWYGVRYINADGTGRIWDKDTASDVLIAYWNAVPVTPAHEHTFADTYTYNETHHWYACTCDDPDCAGNVSGFGAHRFDGGDKKGKTTTYTCLDCGYQKSVYDPTGDTETDPVAGEIKYTGISLTLDSDIYMNFYMELPGGAADGGMVFTIGNRRVEGVSLQQNDKGYFFACPLTVLEMAQSVTATFTFGNVDYRYTYSVVDYIKSILNGTDEQGKPYSDEAKLLARKLANLGHYSQLYLADVHDNIVIGADGYAKMNKFTEYDIDVAAAKEALKDSFKAPKATADYALYARTVSLDSATALNYYVTVKNGKGLTAADVVCAEGKEIAVSLYKDNIYIVTIKGITATELGTAFTLTVGTGATAITVKGSVLDYCAALVKTHSGDTDKDRNAVNAMAAFYEYYAAACVYANRTAFPHYETLDAYSWEELGIVSGAISNGTISEEEMDRFIGFAERAETKKVALNNNNGYLYVRIIGFNHDVCAADHDQKAGITFMAVNSINQGYYSGDKGSNESTYAVGWENSPLRDKMQSGGEIYNLIPLEVLSQIKQVTKQSFAGWTSQTSYDAEPHSSNDYLFLLSGNEVGTDDFGSGEGTKYEYIDCSVCPGGWITGDGTGVLFPNVNAAGYEFIKNHISEYSSIYEMWNALRDAGGFVECDNFGHSFLRSTGNKDYCDCGTVYFSGDVMSNAVWNSACVAPCFCI